MDNTRNRYRMITLAVIAALFVFICSTYIYFITNIGKVYEEHAVESILDIKKDFLKNIVENLILEIEITERQEKQHYRDWTYSTSKILNQYYEESPKDYIALFIKFCELGENKDLLSVSIKDTSLNEIIYESGVFLDKTPEEEDFSSFYKTQYDTYEVSFGVSNQYLEDNVKQIMSDRVRSRRFSQDSYIWINEIKSYEGGDDYAIRAVHPNYPNEEGKHLSTDMQDVMGNYPYMEELKGINQKGEIFFNYHYEKKGNGGISETISYAKLYEKYDWVIVIGVDLDDIQSYINISTDDQNQIVKKTISQIIIFMIITFIFYWILISKIEKWYYGKYNIKLKEVFIDPLTKAKNRRAATIYMESAFKRFKKTGESPMIMMIDIDDFKQVNDTFGHLEGDMVLENVVKLINDHIRGTDTLYRWGGEEFLLICDGLKEEGVIAFSNKIISLVGSKEYEFNGEKYNATISVGVDRFDPLDRTYEDGIKRADEAMYNAKRLGKNRACLGDMCGNNPLIKY